MGQVSEFIKRTVACRYFVQNSDEVSEEELVELWLFDPSSSLSPHLALEGGGLSDD